MFYFPFFSISLLEQTEKQEQNDELERELDSNLLTTVSLKYSYSINTISTTLPEHDNFSMIDKILSLWTGFWSWEVVGGSG